MRKQQGFIGLLLVAAAVAGIWQWQQPASQPWQMSVLDAARDPVQVLPPTAAGRPLDLLQPAQLAEPVALQPDDSGLPGSTVRGRVARMYYRTHDNIFLAAEHTPTHQRIPERLFVEVEYPDPLKSGARSALTWADEGFADVRIGDVVSLRLAHKHHPKAFPVRETTRVTSVVARRDTALAQAFEMRIAARKTNENVAAVPAATLSQALGAK